MEAEEDKAEPAVVEPTPTVALLPEGEWGAEVRALATGEGEEPPKGRLLRSSLSISIKLPNDGDLLKAGEGGAVRALWVELEGGAFSSKSRRLVKSATEVSRAENFWTEVSRAPCISVTEVVNEASICFCEEMSSFMPDKSPLSVWTAFKTSAMLGPGWGEVGVAAAEAEAPEAAITENLGEDVEVLAPKDYLPSSLKTKQHLYYGQRITEVIRGHQ